MIVPLMQKRFVNELKWIDEEEMLDLVAIAQSAPGPIAVNASIIIGYRMAGIRGALATSLGGPQEVVQAGRLFREAPRLLSLLSSQLWRL